MGNKRLSTPTPTPPSRRSPKRQRTSSPPPPPRSFPTARTPPPPATPARPPRMPRFSRDGGPGVSDRKYVQRLNRLTAADLVALVKDVEVRFRRLATFEAEEIRRAQALGFGSSRGGDALKVVVQTVAW